MASDTPRRPRAGRNLAAAIVSSLVLGGLVLVALFTWKWLFAVVVIAAMVIAVREFTAAFAHSGIRLARTPLYAGAVIIPAAPSARHRWLRA